MDATLSQVGFAEFVGKLLSEVFDAVVTSQLDQRRRIDELVDSARLSEEEVASRFIDEAQVEAEIAAEGLPDTPEVRAAVRLRLARSYLAALRALVDRGAPQLVIDSGRMASKLTFQLAASEPAPAPAFFSTAPASLRRRFDLPAAATAPPPFRLAVRQANDRAPQLSRLQVDVYGEVEVHFRTLLS